jgi:hypothetical protein
MTFFPRTPQTRISNLPSYEFHHFGVHKFLSFPPIGKPLRRKFVTLEKTFVAMYQAIQLKLI